MPPAPADPDRPGPSDSEDFEFALAEPNDAVPIGPTVAYAPGSAVDTAGPPVGGRPAVASIQFGRYVLDRLVARSGMSLILRGRDTVLGREIAFKVLPARHRCNAALRRRFLAEARISAMLQHPGVVPVHELGQMADGRPYFTMDLVNGRTLVRELADRADPTERLPHLLKVFEQIGQVVAYAHSRGVVHRDLKPGNVMVAGFGVVYVMDWGIAKLLRGEVGGAAPPAADVGRFPDEGPAADGPATEAGAVVGTPGYMPPEQARGEVDRIDERADVFGLGAILCEVLTGRPPYPGDDLNRVYEWAATGDLADAFARLDGCRTEPEMAALAKRCLSSDPAGRPADAGAVAAAVTAYLESDLRRAERDLVRFFDLSFDLFCVAGLDGYFRRVNPNFSRVLGYSTAELLSRPFLDFVLPADRPATLEAMAQLTAGQPLARFRNRYRDAGGGYRWLEWTAKSIPEEDVIFAVARDVTEGIETV